jgi:hypothetical protein
MELGDGAVDARGETEVVGVEDEASGHRSEDGARRVQVTATSSGDSDALYGCGGWMADGEGVCLDRMRGSDGLYCVV